VRLNGSVFSIVKAETPAAAAAPVSTVAEQTPLHVKVCCNVVVM